MFHFRTAFVFAVAFSTLGFSQVTVTPGGFATTPGPTVPEAVPTTPLVVTPSVSLPGHGPAWASSLPTQIGVPTVDPSQPSVWNPALGQFGGTQDLANNTGQSGQGGVANSQQTTTTNSDVVVPPVSLGEVAKQYRHTQTAQGKVYTNTDLEALHSSGNEMQSSFRPENASTTQETNATTNAQATNPEPSGNGSNAEPSNEMGGNAAGLPQSDQPVDSYDTNGKPNAGHRSVRDEVQRELQQMKNKK